MKRLPNSNEVFDLIGAIYAVDRPQDEWLRSMLHSAQPYMDRGAGIGGYFCDMPSPGTARAWGLETVNADATLLRPRFDRWCAATSPALMYDMITNFVTGFRTEFIRWCARRRPFGSVDYMRNFAVTEIAEMFGVNGFDARHGSCIVVSYQDEIAQEPAGPEERFLGRQMARHLADAMRRNHRHLSEGATLLDSADAIMDPDGHMLHAVDWVARDRLARGALREAACAADRARSRKHRLDCSDAARLWQRLSREGVTIVDHYDRGGRRYLLAIFDAPGPNERKLSPREIEVITDLEKGMSYKQIAAELGIAVSTVAAHVARARKKLGVTGFAALVREFAESQRTARRG